MLRVEELESGYGTMQVLWKPSLEVKAGSLTALLGPNGAGKSTLLYSILGSVQPWRGSVVYRGEDVTALPPHRKVALGLTLVPEGRHVFPTMTVAENLAMGAYHKAAARKQTQSLELVYELFPALAERRRQPAGSLSGGEQQMLTIGRSLMTRPKLLMLDEPSQGLAPKLVAEVFARIQSLRSETGLTILLVEQNAAIALELSDQVYILHEGQIRGAGPAAEIADSSALRQAYLGG